ncbi:MAG TPA: YjbE family putative metal transport protein [Gammaproteobacteria bacterium]|nr:YjbE family putative metal transport protein [Gammaproteobacteria bacterium]
MDWFSVGNLWALVEVVLVNLVLSVDNAIVVGMAVAGLPAARRLRVMAIGIGGATLLRILFAAFTVQLLRITGLVLVGGLFLLWVCWKLWTELRGGRLTEGVADGGAQSLDAGAVAGAELEPKTMREAVIEIIVADVSMSLDNVLAVAGAAREHLAVLVFGLVLSIAFMGIAAAVLARLLNRYHWIAYVGLAVIVYVAFKMIWDGARDVLPGVT